MQRNLTILAFAACILLTQGAALVAQQSEVKLPDAIRLSVGRSRLIKAPWPVKRVSISDPKVTDVEVVSPTQVLVVAKSLGSTDLILWSEKDETYRAVLSVDADVTNLQGELKDLFPKSKLELYPTRDTTVVRGMLPHADDAERLDRFLKSTGRSYVNLTRVAGVQQVMIRVRVAEANRQVIRSLGINAVHADNHFFGGSTIGGNPNNLNIGLMKGALARGNLPFTFNTDTAISPTATLFAGFPDADIQLFLEALAENRYLRMLAEPTLVALSGEEASFLAGGEFPIPVVQSASGGTGTSISIEFKEFGVRLRFRPTVLGDGTIRLVVAPEVSDISDVGAVTVSGFTIPSLLTRRAETTLEMKNGQTFALAGLIEQSVSARSSGVPGIGRVPVLGSLFRSVRYENGETELIVLATVSLVEPLSTVSNRPLPGDLHEPPNDWELYGEGRIEGRARSADDAQRQWLTRTGMDQLKGPGAWARYGQTPTRMSVQASTSAAPRRPAKDEQNVAATAAHSTSTP